MNAQEARRITTEANESFTNTQYKQIKELISKVSEKGEYNIYVGFKIRDEVKQLLINENFTIGKTESHRDEMSTRISW